MKSIFHSTFFILFLVLASCESNNTINNKDNADTTVENTADNDTIVVFHDRVSREKTQYRVQVQSDVDSTENYIAEMDKKMENAGDKAKQQWQQTKSKLQQRLERAKADMNEFGDKADNEWDNFREKVKANLDSLRNDWKNADTDIDVEVKKK